MNLLLPVAGVLAAGAVILSAVGRRAARDRLRLVGAVLGVATVLLVVQRLSAWTPTTVLLWYLAVAVAAVGVVLAVRRVGDLPWREPGHPVRGPFAAGGNGLAFVVLGALLL